MDMGIDAACCHQHSFTCQSFSGGTYRHSRSDSIHNIRISRFSYPLDFSIFDTNISFNNSSGVNDQRIGNYKIQITITAAGFH